MTGSILLPPSCQFKAQLMICLALSILAVRPTLAQMSYDEAMARLKQRQASRATHATTLPAGSDATGPATQPANVPEEPLPADPADAIAAYRTALEAFTNAQAAVLRKLRATNRAYVVMETQVAEAERKLDFGYNSTAEAAYERAVERKESIEQQALSGDAPSQLARDRLDQKRQTLARMQLLWRVEPQPLSQILGMFCPCMPAGEGWNEFTYPKVHKWVREHLTDFPFRAAVTVASVQIVRIMDPSDADLTLRWDIHVAINPWRMPLAPESWEAIATAGAQQPEAGLTFTGDEQFARRARGWKAGDKLVIAATVSEVQLRREHYYAGYGAVDSALFSLILSDTKLQRHIASPPPEAEKSAQMNGANPAGQSGGSTPQQQQVIPTGPVRQRPVGPIGPPVRR